MSDTDVRYASAWIPVRDADMIDFGIGTEEDRAAAQARLDADDEATRRYWQSLPRRVRLARTLNARYGELQWRVRERLHAWLFPDHEDYQ